MSTERQTELITTTSALAKRLAQWVNHPAKPPSLYMKLEGANLGRHGSISLVSIYIRPEDKVYLIDVDVLKGEAFTTTDDAGNSLKHILECTIPKVVFDVRNYSDALFNLFQISLDGIIDIQLMELALRKGEKVDLATLSNCVRYHSKLSKEEKSRWTQTEPGYDYENFNQRPLGSEMIRYSVQGARILASLWDIYSAGLKPPSQAMWRCLIRETTRDRIAAARNPRYKPQVVHKESKPWYQEFIDEYGDNWNDNLIMMMNCGMEYDDENDRWIHGGIEDNLDDFIEDDDQYSDYDDGYQDTARDYIGWEEDMIKNGEWF